MDLKDKFQRTAFKVLLDKKMFGEREKVLDRMMKHLKEDEPFDESLEQYKLTKKVKDLLPSSVGLRDCIKSIDERFTWSYTKY